MVVAHARSLQIAREFPANAPKSRQNTRSIKLRTPLIAMRKLRISKQPART
ncbi:MAG TPA: hypothetical protein VL919_03300 [Vicinamibacterales bacterium]|nr:hypothetical protein [Vicinamibacterales bacterium]